MSRTQTIICQYCWCILQAFCLMNSTYGIFQHDAHGIGYLGVYLFSRQVIIFFRSAKYFVGIYHSSSKYCVGIYHSSTKYWVGIFHSRAKYCVGIYITAQQNTVWGDHSSAKFCAGIYHSLAKYCVGIYHSLTK